MTVGVRSDSVSRNRVTTMETTTDIAMPGPLMAGKRGLVMGVANERSIAWGIARVLHGQGADLAFSYQGGAFGRRAVPLAQSIGATIIEEADVDDLDSVKRVFEAIRTKWGSLDFVVHALAFSDRNELRGRYCDTTRANFTRTMVISCFSFTEICKLASELMPNGGSLLTLTYGGSTRVVPCYNVMGVAKAALEASVRYLASDFGARGIRVNALSAGPMRTLAGAGISDARTLFHFQQQNSPMRRSPTLDEVGGAALYLLSDLSSAVTGEVHFVDCGYSTIAMPNLENLKASEREKGERPESEPAVEPEKPPREAAQ
jgi:enoyl-[acyl-carrier protein] reductase I